MSNFLIFLIGFWFALFSYWRRLKEDYASKIIFSSIFYVIIGLIVGGTVGGYLGLWFWISLLGALLAFLVARFRFNLHFVEVLEAVVLALGIVFAITSVGKVLFSYSLGVLIDLIQALLALLVFFYVDRRYKSFSWYRSGRVGIAGLASSGFYFITRGVIMLYLTRSYIDVLLSSAVAFLLFAKLYNLSRSSK